jgi:hypothetical protein
MKYKVMIQSSSEEKVKNVVVSTKKFDTIGNKLTWQQAKELKNRTKKSWISIDNS